PTVLHQRFPQVRARPAGCFPKHFRLLPPDRTRTVVRRRALVFRPSGLRQGNQLADRGRAAILDLGLFQERARHGRYRFSFFPSSSPPSAMVTPSVGTWSACPSPYQETRSVTSVSSLESAVCFFRLAASSCATPIPTATQQIRVTSPSAMLVIVNQYVDGSFTGDFSLQRLLCKKDAMHKRRELPPRRALFV